MNKKDQKVIDAIKKYQVPGAVGDFNEDNFEQEGVGFEWSSHIPGTLILPNVGTVFLGMPTGFNRIGPRTQESEDRLRINIFSDMEHHDSKCEYNKFNVPVWKYFDGENTIVKGIMPRIMRPFLHVILGNVLDKVDCLEITDKDISEMN